MRPPTIAVTFAIVVAMLPAVPVATASASMTTTARTTVVTAFATTAVVAGALPRAAAAAKTVRVVVRPVTATGRAAPGYKVTVERDGAALYCNYPRPSPAAVDKNIAYCSPSSEYALACWKSVTPGHALCLRDPLARALVKIATVGRFTPTAPARDKAPLAITLGNGARCSLRDGGAGSSLRGHPNWYASYYCNNGSAVWALAKLATGANHGGIDESHPRWTVHVAPESGNGKMTVRVVSRVWFVGTHR